ncbi:hypothetical protein B0J14DRAFT_466318 [Halenospora varia]|nr:hypothetical protein B0J14DRAFT_466318 [Halenospora varia]
MARLIWHDPFWDGKRKGVLIAIAAAGFMLILLFLGNMSYIYGSLFNSNNRAQALNILAVDFDGGVIGRSLSAAYTSLQGNSFPSLHFHSASEYPTVQDVRNAVCRGDYWGAVVAQPGASNRLAAALGGGAAAASYPSNNTLTYIYNAVRYPAVELGEIVGNLQTLIGAATPAYHALNGSNAIQILNTTDRVAVLAFTDPIRASSIDIMPTPQGTRVLHNTVTMVLPIIQQFFFLMALNGINNSYGAYGRLRSSRIITMRIIIAFTYTFIASLTIAGYIWAFRENWPVNGNQFVLTWMMFWLYTHINFLVMDTVTAFIPPSFLSFFVLTWVITNVTSTIYPFELNPEFYRWSYALPAHEVYSVLVTIWSGGCANQLYRALPILFSWEVVGVIGATAGTMYRNRNARKEVLALEKKEKNLDSRDLREAEDLERLEKMDTRGAGPSFPMPFLGGDKRPPIRRQGTV